MDVEEETVRSPLTPATKGKAMDFHEITLVTNVLATITEVPAPSSTIMATPSTWVAPFANATGSWVPSSLVLEIGESSVGPASWLSKPSPRGEYLLGGVPPDDLEFFRKVVSPSALHRNMMHYMTKVKTSSPMFFVCCFFYLHCFYTDPTLLWYLSFQTVDLMVVSI